MIPFAALPSVTVALATLAGGVGTPTLEPCANVALLGTANCWAMIDALALTFTALSNATLPDLLVRIRFEGRIVTPVGEGDGRIESSVIDAAPIGLLPALVPDSTMPPPRTWMFVPATVLLATVVWSKTSWPGPVLISVAAAPPSLNWPSAMSWLKADPVPTAIVFVPVSVVLPNRDAAPW